MSQQHFYIRTDASPVIGTGHFVRCLNLAKSLIAQNSKVTFISRALDSSLSKLVNNAGCRVVDLSLQNRSMDQSPDDYSTWLGVSQYDDICQCLDVIDDKKNASIIVDHYGVNEEWFNEAKKKCEKLVVIDDLANRTLNVDLVVNQNPGWTKFDYAHLVGQQTKLLIGPQFAIISRKYESTRHNLIRNFTNLGPLRILVSLGGTDIENITGKIARILERLQKNRDYVVTLVAGPMNPNSNDLESISERSNGKIKMLRGKNCLVDAYLCHDVAIGAVGGSAWERCCLGLPCILVPIATNQEPAAKILQKVGAGLLLEYGHYNFECHLREALLKISNKDLRRAISNNAMQICDGLGARRVAEEIIFG